MTGGGGGKPANHSSRPSYGQAVAKINEIITYCDAHPGDVNNDIKSVAQMFTSAISQSDWDNSNQLDKSSWIGQINILIDGLQ
jgi:hypothetical protein